MKNCQAIHLCSCGEGEGINHPIGKTGCNRFIPDTFPEILGSDPDDEHNRWIVDGHLITEYTLKFQRGYHQHPCGCWSRWEGSVNSLPDET